MRDKYVLLKFQRFVNQTFKNVAKFVDTIRTEHLNDMLMDIRVQTDTWRRQPLRIAVIGCSGCGKSSFINAIRGIGFEKSHDPLFAPVGVTQTTTEIKEYRHPEFDNLSFWDIPGVGTPEFLKETYVQKIDITQFDFFMILSAVRFTELDSWLANEIKKQNKTYYFIRTKLDVDIQNNAMYGQSRDTTVRQIRENLRENNSDDTHCFLISNHKVQDFDFPDLLTTITNDITLLKRDALATQLTSLTVDHLNKKYKKLQEGVESDALKSALAAAVPIPLTGIVFDIVQTESKIKLFKEHFGTDKTTAAKFESQSGIAFEKLLQDDQGAKAAFERLGLGAVIFCGKIALEALLSVPIVGSAIGALTAGPTSFITLNKMLDVCYQEARIFHKRHVEWLARQ